MSPPKPAPDPPQPVSRIAVGAAVGVLLVLFLQAGGDEVLRLLRYDRGPVEAGQLWRLVTAHVVHLGWGHAVLNAAAFGLILVAFGPALRPAHWAWVVLSSLLVVDAGLWFIHPEVQWYAGLSGVLHGMVAAAAIAVWPANPRIAFAILAVVSGKLLWEFAAGPLPFSERMAGNSIIVQAHFWGAAGGALAALVVTRRHRGIDPL